MKHEIHPNNQGNLPKDEKVNLPKSTRKLSGNRHQTNTWDRFDENDEQEETITRLPMTDNNWGTMYLSRCDTEGAVEQYSQRGH
jgi:hypothetical protein